MSTPKAKKTTMADVKLRKAQDAVASLTEQLSQASMGILNMRQMYEGATQEKLVLQSQLQSTSNMLVGILHQTRGKSITLKKATFEKIRGYAGLDTKEDNGKLILTLVTVEEAEEMEEEIDDMEGVRESFA